MGGGADMANYIGSQRPSIPKTGERIQDFNKRQVTGFLGASPKPMPNAPPAQGSNPPQTNPLSQGYSTSTPARQAVSTAGNIQSPLLRSGGAAPASNSYTPPSPTNTTQPSTINSLQLSSQPAPNPQPQQPEMNPQLAGILSALQGKSIGQNA